MTRKAAIVVSDYYQNNNLFKRNDPAYDRDDCLYCFSRLREKLGAAGIELNTSDISKVSDAEIVIYNDMPRELPEKLPGQKFYLLALESIAIHPANFEVARYGSFDKVFTWYDNIVDRDKVVKVNYAFLFKTDFDLSGGNKNKLVCLMANNKRSSHPGELYTTRKKAIAWFEAHHPEDFDLFGQGWDLLFAGTKLAGVIRRLGLKRFFRRNLHACYRGIAQEKLPVVSRYRFSLCFENVRDIPGYITEKIFDCFFAGCVPVYLGANNVTDYIPSDCFIDMRRFKDFAALYQHLVAMSNHEYLGYLQRIKGFLTSEASYAFTGDYFADTVARGIAGE
ncbi:glycosyltransferase family 10 domain-containing protein [Geomonas limicola]|nr:glycosyltransferase family 10 [Geomonas limicola]